MPETMGAESEYTLYAVWRTVEYTISYTLNGGSVSGNPGSYTIESDTFRLENPTRAGYAFAGWTGTGLEEPTFAVTVLQGSTGNREYAATWGGREQTYFGFFREPTGDKGFSPKDKAYKLQEIYGGTGDLAKYETLA